mmetsp:Transcript_37926/g.77486  ORF Transcript_37926/g.77486 Transcript_37926/m.77486 type:complete len:117 (+) Transcript_37926:72-422(+)
MEEEEPSTEKTIVVSAECYGVLLLSSAADIKRIGGSKSPKYSGDQEYQCKCDAAFGEGTVSATHFILRLGVINIELLKEVTAVASMYGSVQTVNNTLGSSTAMKRTLWSTMLEVRV